MALSKFSDMWKLMLKHGFEVTLTAANEDLRCIICKRVMIDASQSACGCQFCYECISDYIGDKNMYCPGSTEECNEEYLVLERDVMKNIRVNNRISKLKVECPNIFCHSTIELMTMKDHLRVCKSQPKECPYIAIGCDKLFNHDQNDLTAHTQLLMEWINNLKNEVDELQKEISENLTSKKNNYANIEQIMEIIEEQKEELKNLWKELGIKENRILTLEKESKSKNNQITKLQGQVQEVKLKLELTGSKELMEQIEERSKLQIKKIEEEKKEFELRMKNKLETKFAKLKNEIVELSTQMDKVNKYISENKPSQHLNQNFSWKLINVSNLRMQYQTVVSEPFYMNNYKLSMSVFMGGNGMSLWCYIMKGKNDKNLIWPMPLTVVLSVINQHTSEAYKTQSFQYDTYKNFFKAAFERPTNFRNEYSIGSKAFVLFSDIEDIPGIIVEDNIVVSCAIIDLKNKYQYQES